MSSDPGPVPAPTSPSAVDVESDLLALAAPGWLAEPACCCPSRPWFRVFVPTADIGGTTDLLLCAHHFRISRARLAALGAWAYDRTDNLLSPTAWRLGE